MKPVIQKLNSATASQVTSKKESKMEAKGLNRTKDIHIENFDIAYGDRYVSHTYLLVDIVRLIIAVKEFMTCYLQGTTARC